MRDYYSSLGTHNSTQENLVTNSPSNSPLPPALFCSFAESNHHQEAGSGSCTLVNMNKQDENNRVFFHIESSTQLIIISYGAASLQDPTEKKSSLDLFSPESLSETG